MGLEIGKRGLMAHQQALHTTGHNISNAENKEYSRQRVVITSADPLYDPSLNRAMTPGQIGQGSVVSIVERIRNSFLDDRIQTETNMMGYWKSKSDFIYRIEAIYNEPNGDSIKGKMDKLWKSFQELSKYPENRATREVVKQSAITLSNEVNKVYTQLADLQNNVNKQVSFRVNEINMYGRDIRDLNERILKAEAVGDQPNDLKDRRDAIIEKLSEIVKVTVGRTDKDEVIVYIGSQNFVQGEIIRPIEAKRNPDNKGFHDVVWKHDGKKINAQGGKLEALLEVRDKILKENINNINAFAVNLVDVTNEVHRDGFGRKGETNVNFFKHMNISDNNDGNYDLNTDGIIDTKDVTAIFKVSGNNKVDASAAIGVTGTLRLGKADELNSIVEIDYKASDSVNSVIKKINDADVGVVAYLNHNNKLTFKAVVAKDNDKKNFMMRYVEDSGQFLVGLTGVLKQTGPQGSFDYRRINDIKKFLATREHITITPKHNPASHMSISKAIDYDVDKIAAAQGKDVGGTGDFNTSNSVGDGTNSLRLAKVLNQRAMVDKNTSFSDFLTSLISKAGTQGQEAKDRVKNQETLMKNLSNLRQSVSGINLDEEMSNMVAFQHGYNAAARVISTMDKMLETIIMRMGV